MQEEKASDEEFSNMFIKVGKIQFGVLALILTGFILFGKYFIQIWAGNEYINSYYIACILIIPMTVPLIQSVGLNILQAKNKNKQRSIILLVIAIINLIITIPLAKKYEGIGSAIGTSISVILGQIIILNIYYKKCIGINITRFWKEILKESVPVVISFIIGIIYIWHTGNNNLWEFLIGIILYSVIYCILFWNLGIKKEVKKQL